MRKDLKTEHILNVKKKYFYNLEQTVGYAVIRHLYLRYAGTRINT